MKSGIRNAAMGILLGFAFTSLCIGASAQSENAAGLKLPQQYSATAIGQAGPAAGKTLGVTIIISGVTSDQVRDELLSTLKTKGQDGVVSALEKLDDVGRVAPVGSVGTGFRYVRARSTPDGGLQITMATNRPITFGELYEGTRSRDYPIGLLTLSVDKDGNGTGLLYVACKVKFDKQERLVIENFGQKPLRLANVRRQK